MASNVFMLSYTVSRKEVHSYYDHKAKSAADHVRDKIPKVNQYWETHGDVDTTLTGNMDLSGYLDKISAARSMISEKIKPLFKEVPSDFKPEVSCVLVVNGINDLIKFNL